ncbi:MAG: Na+/H+ antiporter subunit C [Rubinisphaera brasiliensis]|uniref:Multisubunit sodium/proton antiporter, MrpC subunit n=1 Tax=Rubinisphaera brasiliensis (strain ATCC 49424 / DSM 5305 / JCM 21570 / IAM 15109 / NBRC 103401 / IFAM 1448) TaxID=756272 RepID=F0SH93_RUBBR|nr:Na+/H+ antiporter subunit C [Rubinisphaera brasiliensis]ADY60634.1 multisubunit sodium/proton antiporter, MrpC subunit [Rubinisphaera brasiliensis DSM 5305]MBR9800845.1 Na+/H+ antiporter subunit C [bacterium]
MDVLLAITVGGLYAAGIYMMLRRSVVKLLIGLGLLSHAANLLIFTAGGIVRGRVPVIPEGRTQPLTGIADPLPQALILTAIVISFAVLAFALVLIYRTYQTVGTDDVDQLKATDT